MGLKRFSDVHECKTSYSEDQTNQNKTNKPKFDVAKVTANRAHLLIPVSSLILSFKNFYTSHLWNLWSFTHLLRLHHTNFASVQPGKPGKEGNCRQGRPKHRSVKPEPGSQSGRMGFSLIFWGAAGEQGQMRLREMVPVTMSSSVLATDISRAVLGGKRTKEV